MVAVPCKMREITSHKVNPANDVIKITVTDEPGADGANHAYEIEGYDAANNPSFDGIPDFESVGMTILFQNGPIAESGVNGVTQEVLLAIMAGEIDWRKAGKEMGEMA